MSPRLKFACSCGHPVLQRTRKECAICAVERRRAAKREKDLARYIEKKFARAA